MKQITGSPYTQNARVVVETEAGDAGKEIAPSVDILLGTVPVAGALLLPANPQVGKTIRIIGVSSSVDLDGNGHPIAGGGATVPFGVALDLTFGGGVWSPSGASQALDQKANCRVLLAAAIPLSGLPIIDGVQTDPGDRILRNVGSSVPNGIYVAAAGAWSRSADMPSGSSAENVFVFISQGATYADTGWLCTTDRPSDVVGTDPIAFTQFSTFPLSTTPPLDVTTGPALVGVSNTAARGDHVHHAPFAAPGAPGTPGFMSGPDKTKLDAIPPAPDRGLVFSDVPGGALGASTRWGMASNGADVAVGTDFATAGDLRLPRGNPDTIAFEIRWRKHDGLRNLGWVQFFRGSNDGSGNPYNAIFEGTDVLGSLTLDTVVQWQRFVRNSLTFSLINPSIPTGCNLSFLPYGASAVWFAAKNVNQVMAGIRSSLFTESDLAGGQSVWFDGFCNVVPTRATLPVNGVTRYVLSTDSNEYYVTPAGAIRMMYGGGATLEYTFATDANHTLTSDESYLHDGYIILANGVVQSAPRTITSLKPPTKASGRIYFANLNPQDMTFKFTGDAGPGVTVPGGGTHWAIIYGDGTRAKTFASA